MELITSSCLARHRQGGGDRPTEDRPSDGQVDQHDQLGVRVADAGVVITSKLARKKQDRRIEQLVGREVKKAIKARQPKGLSFDLFG